VKNIADYDRIIKATKGNVLIRTARVILWLKKVLNRDIVPLERAKNYAFLLLKFRPRSEKRDLSSPEKEGI